GRDTVNIVEAPSLHELGVNVDLGAGEWPYANERCRAHRLACLRSALQAIGPLIGRTEGWVTLFEEGWLAMHVPIAVCGGRRVAGSAAGLSIVQSTIEADAQRMLLGCRFEACSGSERNCGRVKVVVDILQSCSPLRRDRYLCAAAQRPTGPELAELVISSKGAFDKAGLRPGKSPGSIDEPAIERITDPAT